MTLRVAIIGTGPAGLMAADVLSAAGVAVTMHERMPSPGRKFLMAGRGGLNLTHSEPLDPFLARYRGTAPVTRTVRDFAPDHLRAFADELGQETFVGTSGRVFPKRFKASPMLRAWLARLRERGVSILSRESFVGFEDGHAIVVDTHGERRALDADATILALGGASWPKLGADGAWVAPLREAGVAVAPLRAANCGVAIAWSPAAREKFAGTPLKRMAFTFGEQRVRGEAVLTQTGLEGGAIYTLASAIGESFTRGEDVSLNVDLLPDISTKDAVRRLAMGRAGDSLSNMLRKRLSLPPVALALLREGVGEKLPRDAESIVRRVKNVLLPVTGVAGLARAISTAGGIEGDALDHRLMLKVLPGVFVAGEMLDFDAPTGGYLLQACFATGAAAARGATEWLNNIRRIADGDAERSADETCSPPRAGLCPRQGAI